MKTFRDCFDKDGNFKLKSFDPYRYEEDNKKYVGFYNLIFNEWNCEYFSGSIRNDIQFDFKRFIIDNNFSWSSDAVMLFYAQEMGCNTKGSYPAVYMWR